MGRMFEALKKADAQRDAAEGELVAQPMPVVQPDADEDDDLVYTSTAPFIEVGPNRSVETSLDLPVAPSRQTPRVAEVEPAPAAEEEPTAPPMTISFRPAASSSAEQKSPGPRLASELIAYHCPEHPTSARYAELLKTVTAVAPAEQTPALLFTSALGDGGTTTVTLNLAITAARQGRKRVIVVDADPRRHGVASLLHLAEQPGLSEVLSGAASLEDAIQETEPINVFALTSGVRHDRGGLRLIGSTMRSVLRKLRKQFDLVLVDGPRWDGRPDVVASGLACDAVFVVMPEAEAESPHADQLLQMIPDQGARLGGCVLTASS